jgi:pimeloyl-ACP methyl ester carboxylesterase
MDKALWRDPALGEGRDLDLPQGRIRVHDTGTGEPIVFVHGFLVNANLWRKVVAKLSPDFRCIALELPLGSHTKAMPEDADLSAVACADLVADAIEALGLEDVTLVGNDTGGAICQMVVTRRPERIGRLVLTPCDYRDNFPPALFSYLKPAARIPGALWALTVPLRMRKARRLPIAFGFVAKRPIDARAEDSYVAPGFAVPGVRRDIKKLIKGLDKRYTNEAADRLGSFDKPALIAWAREDKLFKPVDGEALARDLPRARLEWIDDSYTFASEDNPERLVELIAGFVREPVPSPAT